MIINEKVIIERGLTEDEATFIRIQAGLPVSAAEKRDYDQMDWATKRRLDMSAWEKIRTSASRKK